MTKNYTYSTKEDLDSVFKDTFGFEANSQFEEVDYCIKYRISIPKNIDIGLFKWHDFADTVNATGTFFDNSQDENVIDMEIEPNKT